MTAKEQFEKWWAICLPKDEERRVLATGAPGKFVAELAYLAGYKAAVGRCVELARAYEGCDEKILEDIDQ